MAKQGFSPFDVVAWHGNYAPYKYVVSGVHFCGDENSAHHVIMSSRIFGTRTMARLECTFLCLDDCVSHTTLCHVRCLKL